MDARSIRVTELGEADEPFSEHAGKTAAGTWGDGGGSGESPDNIDLSSAAASDPSQGSSGITTTRDGSFELCYDQDVGEI